MKRISAVMITGILLFIINNNTFSQSCVQSFKTTIIEPYHLFITFNKTTNLIFPYSIKSVDRGSRDVLAQKAKGVENILLVKAGRENFTETNLSVITSDGKLYSFILNYSNNPSLLNISFTKDTSSEEIVSLLQAGNDEAQMQLISEQIAKEKRMFHAIHDYKYKIDFRLNGIYINGDVIFCQLEIKNRSNINYDIDMLRFFINDKKKSKRTASQEIEIQPLYVYGDTSVIKGQSKNIRVCTLPKFTISDNKFLSIQMMEKNGGRHLQLRVHNRTIVKAKRVR
jgi:conjugative transposon TraN protein